MKNDGADLSSEAGAPLTTALRFSAVTFSYPGSGIPALRSLDLTVRRGEYVAVLGANGSGKSTLVRLMAGLVVAQEGAVSVGGFDPADEAQREAARSFLGVVLQNPDEQIVASAVEEDVAFGLRNLGYSGVELERRLAEALRVTGLEADRRRGVQFLSGGERQRLSLAGVLALDPPMLVLDEATSMIDPEGRVALLSLAERSSEADGGPGARRTLMVVTHDMEEAARADRVIVLHDGAMVFDGRPRALFLREELESWGLEAPPALDAARRLAPLVCGLDFSEVPLDPAAFAAFLAPALRGPDIPEPPTGVVAPESGPPNDLSPHAAVGTVAASDGAARDCAGGSVPRATTTETATALPSDFGSAGVAEALEFRGISHTYLEGTEYERAALKDFSLAVGPGADVVLVGRTGSGKSTALLHGNGVLLPSSGVALVLGEDTRDASVPLRELRLRATLAVQRPEAALFARFVGDDVAYGPRNKGLSGKGLVAAVRRAMDEVGLPYAEFRDRETAALSGGEKRRAALAGVLALDGELVLLDEPSAGLDPRGRSLLLDSLLHPEPRGPNGPQGPRALVATSHSMEEAARFSRVVVCRDGAVIADADPRTLFHERYDPSWGLALPWTVALCRALVDLGVSVSGRPLFAGELPAALGLAAASGGEPRAGMAASPPESALHPDDEESAGTMTGASDRGPPRARSDSNRSSGKKRPGRRRSGRSGAGIELSRNLTVGQFLDIPSPVAALDPGTKVLGVLALAIPALSSPSPAVAAAALALALAAGAVARIKPSFLLRGLKPALPYLLFVALFQFLFSWPGDSSPAFFVLGPISATLGEALRALMLFLRLFALMAALSLFSATTPLSSMVDAIEALLAPLSRLGVPVRDFSTAAGIALRFVPVLAEEAERIAVAQASRGGGMSGRFRARSLLPLAVPIFVRALERAEALGQAMELRRYGEGRRRAAEVRSQAGRAVTGGVVTGGVAAAEAAARRSNGRGLLAARLVIAVSFAALCGLAFILS